MKNQRPLSFASCRHRLYTRREALLAAAGGSFALLFGMPLSVTATVSDEGWRVIERVQQHLFPDEPQAPGVDAINALGYLQRALDDPQAAEDKAFLFNGVTWLQDMAQQAYGSGFLALSETAQAQLLRRIARSAAGENWLSTLLTYLFEALLTAPAYGGNPGRVGWKWLQYTPGFPLPDELTVYTRLPL